MHVKEIYGNNICVSQKPLNLLIGEIEMEIEALTRKVTPKEKRKERVESVVEGLRFGQRITDFQFDQLYPRLARRLSSTHWTPVEVAIRAAELLADSPKSRVLDVGSGCGKFCTVAALTSCGQFIGVEQRPNLVEIAQGISEELAVTNVSFVHGNMADLDWSFFDSFYMFNPFYENQIKSIQIDNIVPLSPDRFYRNVDIVRSKLRLARPGTKVVTYHGFGGEFPAGYHRLKREAIASGFLELWIKKTGRDDFDKLQETKISQ